MPHSPLSRYEQLIDNCEIRRDAGQERVIHALQHLHHILHQPEEVQSLLERWFGTRAESNTPKGLYIWGGVGRGKSMLMDMFYHSVSAKTKKRVHFHEFMLDIHARMHQARQAKQDDPLGLVANALASRYQLLCFDELQIHDITDASIVARLFQILFEAGMIILFTSNRPPEDLYQHGLQRERFLPFISLIRSKMQVIEISAERDYRQDRVVALQQRYRMPLSNEINAELRYLFDDMIAHEQPHPLDIKVQGRILHVPKACREVAFFDFTDLCGNAYGAADYLELTRLFKVIFIANIPCMDKEQRNEAKRFVTLIDVLYEAHIIVCCSADAPPEQLYDEGDGSFEFERTASRLREMMSGDYCVEH